MGANRQCQDPLIVSVLNVLDFILMRLSNARAGQMNDSVAINVARTISSEAIAMFHAECNTDRAAEQIQEKLSLFPTRQLPASFW
jgi:hypothetical protein